MGGLHLAQLRIAQKMAEQVGDQEFAQQCRDWIEAGTSSMENKMWNGSYYLNYWEPESGTKSDLVFGYQIGRAMGGGFPRAPGVFPPDRVKQTLGDHQALQRGSEQDGSIELCSCRRQPRFCGRLWHLQLLSSRSL